MKIRNKIIALVISLIAMPTFAYSQAKNFAGPSAAINFQTIGSETNITLDGDNLGDVGKTDNIFGIDLSYSAPIDDKFLITFGGTYDLNKQDAGSFVGAVNFKIKDHYSLYLAPTFTVSDNTAVFIKGGYHKMNGEASLDGESDSTKFSGWGYGAGIKTMLDKNLFLQAELQYVDYGSETEDGLKADIKTSAGIISLGYKF
jgi:opacity protein-like surface antigen